MIKVKAIGQTVEKDGDVILAVGGDDMPSGCMVLFVETEEWLKIKDQVELNKKGGMK